jgi:hypothetical protein
VSTAEQLPDPGSDGEADAAGRAENVQVRAMCALLGLEAVLMLGLAVGLSVALATSRRETEVGFTFAEIGLCVLAGVALAFGARGLRRGQRWPRSAMLTLQLVGLPFGFRFVQFGEWPLGVPLLAIVVATLVLLFVTVPRLGAEDGAEEGSEEGAEDGSEDGPEDGADHGPGDGPDPRPARGRRS